MATTAIFVARPIILSAIAIVIFVFLQVKVPWFWWVYYQANPLSSDPGLRLFRLPSRLLYSSRLWIPFALDRLARPSPSVDVAYKSPSRQSDGVSSDFVMSSRGGGRGEGGRGFHMYIHLRCCRYYLPRSTHLWSSSSPPLLSFPLRSSEAQLNLLFSVLKELVGVVDGVGIIRRNVCHIFVSSTSPTSGARCGRDLAESISGFSLDVSHRYPFAMILAAWNLLQRYRVIRYCRYKVFSCPVDFPSSLERLLAKLPIAKFAYGIHFFLKNVFHLEPQF